jgi:fibronectin-binding autotransporter adhesin
MVLLLEVFMSRLRVTKCFIYRSCLLSLAAILFLSMPFTAMAISLTWNDPSTTGDWSTSASWNPLGVPTTSDNVYIALTGATANITQPGMLSNAVYIGYTGLGTGHLSMTSGDLTQYAGASINLGLTESGTFDLSGGTVNTGATGVNIGGSSATYYNKTGTLNVSGGAILYCQGGMNVGQYGTGNVTQTNATVRLYNSLFSNTYTTLNIGNYFPAGGQSHGTYTLNSGTLEANVCNLGVYGNGELDQNGGTVTLYSTTSGLGFGIYANSVGTYNLHGGTLNLRFLKNGAGTAHFNIGGGTLQAGAAFSSAVPINLDGVGSNVLLTYNATIDTNNNAVTLSGALSGSSGLDKIGGNTLTLSNANTYAGATNVQVGTLSVTGSLSSIGTVAVSPAAILAGSGSVGSVTVNGGGHIAPGVSGVGTLTDLGLTLDSGAILDYDLDTPAASDLISMSSSILALNGQQFADFNFNALAGFGPGTYTLIDAGSISGTGLGGTVTGQISGLDATLMVSGNDLVLNVVPEPGTLAMLITTCLALLGYAGRVYRRKN